MKVWSGQHGHFYLGLSEPYPQNRFDGQVSADQMDMAWEILNAGLGWRYAGRYQRELADFLAPRLEQDCWTFTEAELRSWLRDLVTARQPVVA